MRVYCHGLQVPVKLPMLIYDVLLPTSIYGVHMDLQLIILLHQRSSDITVGTPVCIWLAVTLCQLWLDSASNDQGIFIAPTVTFINLIASQIMEIMQLVASVRLSVMCGCLTIINLNRTLPAIRGLIPIISRMPSICFKVMCQLSLKNRPPCRDVKKRRQRRY